MSTNSSFNQTPRVAAAYIRVSTEDQIEYSPASQLSEIRKYAASHQLIVPDAFVFADEGISGKSTEKRPAFHRMIGLAKQKPKPFEVLLLWKFSRFARNREDSIVYKSMLRRELNIDVVSVSEPIGDDKISVLIEAMIEAMDEYYSINLAEEVRRGMTQRIRAGKPNTHAPFGYHIQNGAYLPDADTAPVVRKIYSDFLGGKGLCTLAKELSAMGIRTIHGNRFESRSVEYILRNPVYIGKIRWRGTVRTADSPDIPALDGVHEPLIPLEVYEATQRRLAAHKRQYTHRCSTETPAFLLQGLVRCSCCGATLVRTGVAANGEASLQCHQYAHGKCTQSHSVQLRPLTDAVLQQIKHDFPNLLLDIRLCGQTDVDLLDETTLLERQLAKEQQRLQRIHAAYEAGVDTLEEYAQNKNSTCAQITVLEQRRASLTAEHTQLQTSNLDKDACVNQLLHSFVRKIVFDRKASNFKIYYYA